MAQRSAPDLQFRVTGYCRSTPAASLEEVALLDAADVAQKEWESAKRSCEEHCEKIRRGEA